MTPPPPTRRHYKDTACRTRRWARSCDRARRLEPELLEVEPSAGADLAPAAEVLLDEPHRAELRLEDGADGARERVHRQAVRVPDDGELDLRRAVEAFFNGEELKVHLRAVRLLPEAPQERLLRLVVEAGELLEVLRGEHDAAPDHRR